MNPALAALDRLDMYWIPETVRAPLVADLGGMDGRAHQQLENSIDTITYSEQAWDIVHEYCERFGMSMDEIATYTQCPVDRKSRAAFGSYRTSLCQ